MTETIQPPSRVIRIDADESVVLATDENGLEAYRFGFRVKDRETGDVREVRLLEPCWNDWNDFVKATADLFTLLAGDYGPVFSNQWQPDKLEDLTDGDDYRLWAVRTQAVLSLMPVQERVKTALSYLYVEVDGIENEYKAVTEELADLREQLRHIANVPKKTLIELEGRLKRLEARAGNHGPKNWLMQNCEPEVLLTRVFATLLDIPNAVKKNAEYVLTHIFRMETSSQSGRSSQKTSESAPTKPDGFEHLKPSRSFDA